MKVTVGIKALNEAEHIAGAPRSALDAVAPFGGEVILADSGSSDGTIEIARQFTVTILQLADRDERSCGTGAQLAFQHAAGEFFYLLDGDMVLDASFVAAGIAYLEAHLRCAGVGGGVREMNLENAEFQIRAAAVQQEAGRRPGEVDRLDGGGLYRTQAVRDAGYFADRNLHAFEEFELATRLRARGWTLARIDRVAVEHYGYTSDGYTLLWKRIRSGYAGGAGEVLRAAIGAPHFMAVVRGLGHIRNGLAVMAWWALVLLAIVLQAPLAVVALVAVPIAFLWYRRGSLPLALYSLAIWNSIALGLVTGFLHRRTSPRSEIVANRVAPHGDAA